mgnify:CR=1 FL=1
MSSRSIKTESLFKALLSYFRAGVSPSDRTVPVYEEYYEKNDIL